MDRTKPAFPERVGRFFERNGLPPTAGRLLGHLLVCEPPVQTFDELVAAVGASRSTLSVATRLLEQLSLIERFRGKGQRRDHYRLRDDAWTKLLEQDVAAARQLRELADEGLKRTPRHARGRLTAMQSFAVFLEQSYAPVLERWQKRPG